uniref:Uncharacterized protein n=1 Tax=Lactuca sativa TaxID=4236 RepID=A0A9R1UCJ4_LACSA|nr:hypothetical protein LSAT_V11C900485530 [Lactuca sativa]
MYIMSSRLQNPFVGAAFQSSLKPRNVNCLGYLGNKFPRKPRYDIIPRAKKNDWISHGIRFSQSFGENVEILWKNMGLRSGFVVKSVKEPFTRSKAIVRSLSTVWEEGLLLFQCSVFYAMISGVCLLLWYSQLKANTLIESKLFPSVCTTLSDYIQCDLHFCKAQSVSPLSITLESCWIGPHKEEFSCGEVPTLKLRFHPFSSLRTGTIVIDAFVYNRTLLAAQKRKYLWLGIPFTDGVLQKHLSTEEVLVNLLLHLLKLLKLTMLWITNWWRNLRGVLGINQVVRAVLENPSDKTKVHLVYANVMGKVGPGGHPSAIETGTKFYISNLDYSISNDDIKGMAMILQDALAAVKRYNNVELDGKPMNIEIVGLNIVAPVVGFSFPNNSFGNMNGFPRRRSSLADLCLDTPYSFVIMSKQALTDGLSKVFEIDNMKAWKSVLIFATSYAWGFS